MNKSDQETYQDIIISNGIILQRLTDFQPTHFQ